MVFMKKYFILIFTLILIPFSIHSVLILSYNNIFQSYTSAWISYFGNIFGGVISAIIAYVISQQQIRTYKNKEIEKEKERKQNNKHLIIKIYFNEVKKILIEMNKTIEEEYKGGLILNFPINRIPYIHDYLVYIDTNESELSFRISNIINKISYLISIQNVLLEAKEKSNEVFYYSNILLRIYGESKCVGNINEDIIKEANVARTKRAEEFLNVSESLINDIDIIQEEDQDS